MQGPGRNTPACDTPNPPFWCDGDTEIPANIDAYLILLLILGAYLGIRLILKKL